MNQGFEIIMKRMDSNPDEFQIRHTGEICKWSWVIGDLSQRMRVLSGSTPKLTVSPLAFMDDAEVIMVYTKLMTIQGQAFTERVLRTALEEPNKQMDLFRGVKQMDLFVGVR